jgi:hypothetical protein
MAAFGSSAGTGGGSGETGFKVAVESILQRRIKEITYEGEEVYEERKRPSQILTSLADRVDFREGEEDGPAPKRNIVEKWPWESVHSKLSQALTEVSVLSDLLQIVKHQSRYMTLDPVVQQSSTGIDATPAQQILAKKKALGEAAQILSAGAQSLLVAKQHTSSSHGHGVSSDDRYLHALVELRKRWKLKRGPKGIVVDISFASAGSNYMPPTSFEVIKGVADHALPSGSAQYDTILVKIPKELQAQSEILIFLTEQPMKDPGPLCKYIGRLRYPRWPSLPCWERQLLMAQYVIFNKELFTKLCHGVYHTKRLSLPYEMTENQLHIPLRNGKWLSIVHVIEYEDSAVISKQPHPVNVPRQYPAIRPNWELAVRLKKALRAIHKASTEVALPHPATTTFDKELQLAGVNVMTVSEVQRIKGTKDQFGEGDPQSVKLFDDFMEQAKHIDTFQRVALWIDDIVQELKSISVGVKWELDPEGMWTKGKIVLQEPGQSKSEHISLTIGPDKVSVQLGSHKSLTPSLTSDNLKQCIKTQVLRYRLELASEISEAQSWRVLHFNPQLALSLSSSGPALPDQPAGSLVLETKDTKKKLELCLTCQTSKVDVLLGSETLGGVKSFPVDQKYGANFTEQFTKILQLVVSKQ